MSGRPGRNTPIGALLYVTLIDSLLDLNSFVAALGYANIPSGVRTFNSFVNTGLGNPVFLARLQASRFALTPEVLLDALIHTDLQLFSESRLGKAVCPSKHTPDSSPSIHPVFYTARPLKKSAPSGSSKAARRGLTLPMSPCGGATTSELGTVRAKIRQHYSRYCGSPRNAGPIVSYLYTPGAEAKPIVFAVDGSPMGAPPTDAEYYTRCVPKDSSVNKSLLADTLCSSDLSALH